MDGTAELSSPLHTAPAAIRRHHSYLPNFRPASVNPFVNLTLTMSKLQQLKMCLVFCVLGLPRLCLTIVNILIMYLFSSLVLVGIRREHLGEPLSKWRCVFKFPICWCLRLQLFL
jgi:hypothetical protein